MFTHKQPTNFQSLFSAACARSLAAAALALCSAHALAASPAMLRGRVVGVADGDTLTLLSPTNEQHRIRLADIDAPESSQAFGQRAKESLSQMCFNRSAQVQVVDRDVHARAVGYVHCESSGNGWQNANRAQVERGMAWVYERYVRDTSLRAVQRQAMAEHRGLWQDKEPTPPWDYRRANSGGKADAKGLLPIGLPASPPWPATTPFNGR